MNIKTVYEIRNNILNYMKNELSKIEGSYNFDIASAIAQELGTSYTPYRKIYRKNYSLGHVQKNLIFLTILLVMVLLDYKIQKQRVQLQ